MNKLYYLGLDITRYIKYHRLETISILLIMFFLTSIIMGLEFQEANVQKEVILSTILTGLFATFAIVFSLSIVAIQHSTNYSTRLYQQFFGIGTIAYILFFLISFIFPIIGLLKISDIKLFGLSIVLYKIPSNQNLFIKMSLIFTSICLISLIPYWRYLKYKLDPLVFLNNLSQDAIKEIKYLVKKNRLSDIDIPNELKILDCIIMTSYQRDDWDTFQEAFYWFFYTSTEIYKSIYETGEKINKIEFLEESDEESISNNTEDNNELKKLYQELDRINKELNLRTTEILSVVFKNPRSKRIITNSMKDVLDNMYDIMEKYDDLKTFDDMVQLIAQFCLSRIITIAIHIEPKSCDNTNYLIDGGRNILMSLIEKNFGNSSRLIRDYFKNWSDIINKKENIEKLIISIEIMAAYSCYNKSEQNVYECKEILHKLDLENQSQMFKKGIEELKTNLEFSYLVANLDSFSKIFQEIKEYNEGQIKKILDEIGDLCNSK